MSSKCRRPKTVIFSRELPQEAKERVLECMPTREAARCALLSTQWRDAWYRQGRLLFDWGFFHSVGNTKSANNRFSVVSIINNIIMLRAGPVKIFKLEASYSYPKPLQSDIDRWCLFLSRNGVEELHLCTSYSGPEYQLPLCLLSCRTLKQLRLEYFSFNFPADARCMFPGLTSFYFYSVTFSCNVNRVVYSVPKLEKLTFSCCYSASNFTISAPKLKTLTALGYLCTVDTSLLTLHLNSIKSLSLVTESFSAMAIAEASAAFPVAINLQEIKLDGFNFGSGNHLTFAVQLLKKSPNLCVLEMEINAKGGNEADSTLPEGGPFTRDDLKKLKRVKIEGFRGMEVELRFVKSIISTSPAIENVIIREAEDIDASLAFEAPKKLLSFPRGSPSAQLVYKEYKP